MSQDQSKQRDPSFDELITEWRRDRFQIRLSGRLRTARARLREGFPAPVTATALDVEKIRGCADFQALLPAYLGGSLSEARSSSLEDHFMAAWHAAMHCEKRATLCELSPLKI